MDEKPVPTRADQIKRLASGEEFDILVVGGGATGGHMWSCLEICNATAREVLALLWRRN